MMLKRRGRYKEKQIWETRQRCWLVVVK